jgi:hypothetical protein
MLSNPRAEFLHLLDSSASFHLKKHGEDISLELLISSLVSEYYSIDSLIRQLSGPPFGSSASVDALDADWYTHDMIALKLPKVTLHTDCRGLPPQSHLAGTADELSRLQVNVERSTDSLLRQLCGPPFRSNAVVDALDADWYNYDMIALILPTSIPHTDCRGLSPPSCLAGSADDLSHLKVNVGNSTDLLIHQPFGPPFRSSAIVDALDADYYSYDVIALILPKMTLHTDSRGLSLLSYLAGTAGELPHVKVSAGNSTGSFLRQLSGPPFHSTAAVDALGADCYNCDTIALILPKVTLRIDC